jgi:hypothetical protein
VNGPCCGIGADTASRTCSSSNLICQQTFPGGGSTTLTCKACGGPNQPCCSTGAAATRTCSSANLLCQTTGTGTGATSTCVACGASAGQPCCAGRTCTSPLTCTGFGPGATCQ